MTQNKAKGAHYPQFWADAGPSGLIIALPTLKEELAAIMDGIKKGQIKGYQCRWEAHEIEGIPFLFCYVAWGEQCLHPFTIVLTPRHKGIAEALKNPRDVLLVSSLPEEQEEGYMDFVGPMATMHQVALQPELHHAFAAFGGEIH